jgi:hypothetical protein
MSNEVFLLHVLPGGNGDALVLEYGTDGDTHRVLIDGGVAKSATGVGQFLGENADLELLVVTHIDNDHIAGVVKLLNQPHPPVPQQVWFNGFRHLPETGLQAMGPIEGEKLTTLIVDRGYPWNTAFNEGPVATTQPGIDTVNGLQFTVLSPGMEQLRRLRQGTNWSDIVREAGLDPEVPPPPPPPPAPGLERMGPPDVDTLAEQDTDADTTLANGSTIALLSEFAKRTCLLAGDAHSDVLIAGIDQIVGKDNMLEVDVFKLPHHGSKGNVTRELLSIPTCFPPTGAATSVTPMIRPWHGSSSTAARRLCWRSITGQREMKSGIATRSRMRTDIRRCTQKNTRKASAST